MTRLKIVSSLLLFLLLVPVFYRDNVSAKTKRSKNRKRKYKYEVIVMNRKSESRKKTDMRPVIFTHTSHIQKYKCLVCHPSIFVKRRGANDINMQKNAEGKYCGRCHNGRAAWSLLECAQCHSGDPIEDENAVRYAE